MLFGLQQHEMVRIALWAKHRGLTQERSEVRLHFGGDWAGPEHRGMFLEDHKHWPHM